MRIQIFALLFTIQSILAMDIQQEATSWQILPNDMQNNVMHWLDLITVAKLRLANKYLKAHMTKEAWEMPGSYRWALAFQGKSTYTIQERLLTISPDSSLIVTCLKDHTVKIYNVKTRKCLQYFVGHDSELCSAAVGFDNSLLVTSCKGIMKLWNVNTGECLRTIKDDPMRIDIILLSSDNSFIVSGGPDNSVGVDLIKIWDTKTGKCLNTIIYEFRGSIYNIKLSPDNTLIIAYDSFYVKAFDTQTVQPKLILYGHACHHAVDEVHGYIAAMAVCPKNRFIITGGFDGTAKIWDSKTGRCLHTLQGDIDDGRKMDSYFYNSLNSIFYYSIHVLSISTDGRLLATGSGRTIKLWDIETGVCLRTFKGHTYIVNSIRISPDQSFIVSWSSDGTIKIWDIETGQCITTISVNADVYVSNDNSCIITKENNRTKIWDLTQESTEEHANQGYCGIS